MRLFKKTYKTGLAVIINIEHIVSITESNDEVYCVNLVNDETIGLTKKEFEALCYQFGIA